MTPKLRSITIDLAPYDDDRELVKLLTEVAATIHDRPDLLTHDRFYIAGRKSCPPHTVVHLTREKHHVD